MNALETLADKLIKRFPDAITTIDPPGIANGSWWLDVDLKGHAVAIEWRPGKGFGVSTNASEGYGEGPDEVYPTDEAAFQRVSELLTARQRTLPPPGTLTQEPTRGEATFPRTISATPESPPGEYFKDGTSPRYAYQYAP